MFNNPNIISICHRAIQFGARGVFVVGGAVRDTLMGVTPKDNDLLVEGLEPAVLEAALRSIHTVVEVDMVGAAFGIFKVKFTDGEIVDVAMPRTERSTGEGHREFAVVTNPDLTVHDDLSRRDFTMNAIAFDMVSGQLVDPFGGQEDIRGGVIRAVGNAVDRFTDDPLRILRALRFAARFGFAIHRDTRQAMAATKHLIATVAAERVGEEFLKILAGRHSPDVLRFMSERGLLAAIIPEWAASVGFNQNNPHHYATVDIHVLDAYEYVVKAGGSVRARLAVLLHDIAKPSTYRERTV